MSNQEKLRENNSIVCSAVNLMVESTEKLRGLFRALLMATVALGVADCSSDSTPEQNYLPQCISDVPHPEPDDTPQCDGTMFASPQVKEVAVCFMRWSDSYDLTEEIRAKLNAQFDLTSRLFTEATFGRDLYKFNLIDSGTVWAGPSPVTMDDDIDFAVQACAPQIDNLDKVNTFVVFPSFTSSQATGYRKTIHTPKGDREMGVIRLPYYNRGSDTLDPDLHNLGHEIGHADFLLNHATEYNCYEGESQHMTYNPDPNRCQTDIYGNPYDLMGGGLVLSGLPDIEIIFGHMSGFAKSLMGGLVKVTIITKNSGEYPLAALEEPCPNVSQLLRIPYEDVPLCLDYRRPTGVDAPFAEENIKETLGYEAGLPTDGCLFLTICSNDPTKFGYATLKQDFKGTSFLLRPDPTFSNGHYTEQRDRLGACLPREGFCDPNLGINVSYSQSTTNPDAVIVHVSGVDETRIAKLPNLIAGFGTHRSSRILGETAYTENVSENGESVGAFDIQIFGKRISDGEFELIETRTVDGLSLFGKVAINFTPERLASLKVNYKGLQIIVDPENVIDETNEKDNESIFYLEMVSD